MNLISTLKKCVIFEGMGDEEIMDIIALSKTEYYSKGDSIAMEGESCNRLGILLDGGADIEKSYAGGNVLNMLKLESGSLFGEALLFLPNGSYPINVIATSDTTVLFIEKGKLLKAMQNNGRMTENFMLLFSQKIFSLNQRVLLLGMDSLRKRIAHYLLEEHKRQQRTDLMMAIDRKAWAEILGVQRPSLSRELSKMAESGLITLENKKILIVDKEALEAFVD